MFRNSFFFSEPLVGVERGMIINRLRIWYQIGIVCDACSVCQTHSTLLTMMLIIVG
uniref:Uncharacterized protein n=1 Tax=Siphoviridae sp. ctAUQ2 TaxID=2826182 RepID=A0A8S5MYK7_9CAUD|nr:MAG TPA: hypothetical protein [Siphoviridae sp. ctAUQ2]